MRYIVTGATGFIGNHVVSELISQGKEVVILTRKYPSNKKWIDSVKIVLFDISIIDEEKLKFIEKGDKLIHLAWDGLPNYKELYHFEQILMIQYNFLKKIIELGVTDITVSGTCFEYGKINGELIEDISCDTPNNSYALAKNTLRLFLIELQKKTPFHLKWIRLFYMYGEGQSQHSIISQLEESLKNREQIFRMSGGEQLRDYLPIEKVAKIIVDICQQNKVLGIINCCSGKPISIRNFVENYLKEKNEKISLLLGYYPYSDIEPMAFWGCTKKLQSVNV